ncbi:hypothetical protein BHM03_00037279 [Ensete ventricosum]|nr:hypothetical protein BHM03_00037279 [Ensete ventricosum]
MGSRNTESSDDAFVNRMESTPRRYRHHRILRLEMRLQMAHLPSDQDLESRHRWVTRTDRSRSRNAAAHGGGCRSRRQISSSVTFLIILPNRDAVIGVRMGTSGAEHLRRIVEETDWYNGIVLDAVVPGGAWKRLPRPLQSWLRNYIGVTALYLVSGFLWCFYIYYLKRNVYVPKDDAFTYRERFRSLQSLFASGYDSIPSNRAMYLQIIVAMKAMPWFCVLPTLSEYMAENGWTRCFASYEIGKSRFFSLSGLAFHPLDGILQAVPYVIALFLVPTHFATLILLVFLEVVWTENVHDCIHGKIWPVMGAGYHTIHHTTYRHNYGHYTIWMDWMFGTLRYPEQEFKKAD